MALNEHQRRRLEVSLRLFDRVLLEVERSYLSSDLVQGEMFELTSDLTPEEKARIVTTIREIRERLHILRERFQLEPQRRGAWSLLRGYFAHFWAVLSDCRASKLRGYGEVAPQLQQLLDPEIEGLLVLIERLERIVERRDR
ncbi:MAG: hypothetical protein N0A16_13485 [Blastocatellia bacterium]|nr:hypothetical protein [Blastocatellia bacterium]